jgi:excisionase family DNA binding protein
MSYTLGTAAKATGKSKSTIQRAIQSGRMSATPLDNGSYRIDPAELERVFPIVSRDSPTQPDMTQYGTGNDTGGLHGQIQVLRELIGQIEGERDDLRRRLDSADEARQRAEQAQEKAFAELSRLTLLLTHQPKPEPEAQPAPPAPESQPQQQTANQKPRRGFRAAFKDWF